MFVHSVEDVLGKFGVAVYFSSRDVILHAGLLRNVCFFSKGLIFIVIVLFSLRSHQSV